MNEQTAQLIEKLATKLGTTSEYLWGVLIRQAPVSATINLVYFVFIVLAGVGLYKLHKRFCKEDNHGNTIYDDGDNMAVIFPMVFGVLLWVILALVSFFSLGDVFNGFINPEYWALKEVLDVANN